MNPRLEKTVRRWLTHEAAGRSDDAESELTRVFELLPPPVPAPGLSQRILTRARMAGVLPALPSGWHWGLKVAAALCLALSGLAAALVPTLAGAVFGELTFGEMVLRGAQTLAGMLQWTLSGLAFWRTLSSLGHAVSVVAATPEVIAGMVVSLFLGAGALRLLHYLISHERSSVYV